MPKKSKLSTPAWILEGYSSEADYNKKKGIKNKKKDEHHEGVPRNSKSLLGAKAFRIRVCPKCGSDNVGVVLTGEEGKGAKNWECHKCKWAGRDVEEKELSEEEFMKYLDEKGEEVA